MVSRKAKVQMFPHLLARKMRSGRVFFYYDLGREGNTRNGRRKELALGDNYVEAVTKWRELEGNRSDVQVSKSPLTFADASRRYVKDILPGKAPRTREDNLEELEWLMKFFGKPGAEAPLDEIKPVHITQYLQWRVEQARKAAMQRNEARKAKGLKPFEIPRLPGSTRANREKALLSHIFNAARAWGMTHSPNPCAGIKGFKESGRDHYIDPDVYGAIYAAAEPWLKMSMDLADVLGQRPADVRELCLADIRGDLLWLRQNKTGTPLRFRIEGDLKTVIDMALQTRRDLEAAKVVCDDSIVLGRKGKRLSESELRGSWDRARAKAQSEHPHMAPEIAKSQFRDLRAKAGTEIDTQSGMAAARDVLGHTSEAMTRRYIRHRAGKIISPRSRDGSSQE